MADDNHSLHSRVPPDHLAGSGMGAGLVWVLATVAGLGLLVLAGAFGGGSTPVGHPGGAGGDPVVLQPPASPSPADARTASVD